VLRRMHHLPDKIIQSIDVVQRGKLGLICSLDVIQVDPVSKIKSHARQDYYFHSVLIEKLHLEDIRFLVGDKMPNNMWKFHNNM